VTLLVGVTPFLATVQNKDSQPNFYDKLRDANLRKGEARNWRQQFANLDKQIPTLSPAEELWLRTEIDDSIRDAGGVYTKRALDAMDSREYALRVTKPHLRQLIGTLDRIIASDPPGQKAEIRLWTEFASSLMAKKFWQEIDRLVSLKIVGKTVDGVDSFYFENHVLRAQDILLNIVLPNI
jgi:hypothetical protein